MQITDKCSGCLACFSSCPFGAIEIIQNKEGFYEPKINLEKCKNCGKCKRICPKESNIDLKNDVEKFCFAAYSKEGEYKKSSSGGIFALLANYILEENGFVFGASFDESFKKVEHIFVDNKKDLYKLRFSKYLQSNIKNSFKKAKEKLEENKKVLFCGTPCQIAGLKAYLEKEYSNLYLVDLLCHGVPSSLVWEKYLKEVSKGRKIISANFRDKEYSSIPRLLIEFKDNSKISKIYKESLYYRAFMENMTLNDSCYDCKYRTLKRTGDVTLGDFWGIEKIAPKYANNNNGVSLVIANSKKGKELFQKIEPLIFKKRIIIDAVFNNVCKPITKHPNREKFFEELNKKPILENLETSLERKYDGIILNFWWAKNNYGALLSAFAIQKFFLTEGYDFNILNYDPKNQFSNFCSNFVQNNLKLTHKISNFKQLKELNNCTNNFVVGTDQVFRYMLTKKDGLFLAYTLSFCDLEKRKIAFSASFGKDKFDEANFFIKHLFKNSLKRFSAISTRESSGTKICKNFGAKAKDILDPVFLLDFSFWENLAGGG